MAEKTDDSQKGTLKRSGSKDGGSTGSVASRLFNFSQASRANRHNRSPSSSFPSSSVSSSSLPSASSSSLAPGSLSSVSRTDSDDSKGEEGSVGQQLQVPGAREGVGEGREKEREKEKDASPSESEQTVKKKDKEKRGFFSPWHGRGLFPFAQIFMSSHRQKNAEIHRIFTSLPESEKLIDDYSSALQRDILIHGRLYVTQNWLCFYANIFSWETLLTIPFQSVQAITKEKTALVIPNAIQISTTAEKYGFSSLISRDITYTVVFKVWQNSLLEQPLTPLELVKAAKKAWGADTDVVEEDLWGPLSSKGEEKEKEKEREKMKKQASMPTHVELGLLPATTVGVGMAAPTVSMPDLHASNAETNSTAGHSDDTTLTGASQDSQQRPPSANPVVREGAQNRGQEGATAAEGTEAKSSNHANRSDSGHVSNHDVMGPHAMDYYDRGSIGGESVGSSEFETISFTEETGEIPCGCPEHVGRNIMNEVYATDVETIFQLLFTDSEFFRNFLRDRKTINIEIGEWQPQPDATKLRDIRYTLSLNYSFGPKFSPSVEHQVYSKMGQPGLKHIVDTEVVNTNIPYSDTFFVSCRFCMTRVAHNKTRVRIIASINFKKTCWGLVKNLIERNVGDGMKSYYNHLDSYLKEYLATQPPVKRRRVHKRGSRHTSRSRHRHQTTNPKPPSTPPPATPPTSPMSFRPKLASSASRTSLKSFNMELEEDGPDVTEQKKARSASSAPRVNLALTLLLGILIVSNMALYHYLMSYQGQVQLSVRMPQHRMEWPTSRDEWIKLMRQQLEGHDREMERWQKTLYSLVQSLEQIEATVSSARKLLLVQLEEYESSSSSSKQAQEKHQSEQQDPVIIAGDRDRREHRSKQEL